MHPSHFYACFIMFRVVERLACFPAVTGQEAGYQSSKAFNPQAASCLNTNSLAPEIRCATLSLDLSGANKTNSPFPLGPTLHCLSLSSFLCFFVWSNCTKLFISQLYSHIWTTLCHNSSPEQTTTMSFSKNSSHLSVLKKRTLSKRHHQSRVPDWSKFDWFNFYCAYNGGA